MRTLRFFARRIAGEWEKRRGGLFAGLFIFLPALPALAAYLGSRHLDYAPLSLGKWLAVGFIVLLLWHFPTGGFRRRIPGLAAVLLMGLCVWTHAAGFSSWALAFGVAGLLAWRQAVLPGVHRHQTLAALAIFSAMVLPVAGADLAPGLRKVSIGCVDGLLDLACVSHHRSGITFFVGEDRVAVLEKCSGSGMTRMFFLLMAGAYFWAGEYRRAWGLAPFLAVAFGVAGNALRIFTHLLLRQAAGPFLADAAHASIGVGIFLILLFVFLWSGKRTFFRPIKPGHRDTLTHFTASKSPILIGSIGGLALGGFLLAPPWIKSMNHQYREQFLSPSNQVYVNEFVERPGGGGWILLEHPIEQCLAFQGWDLDAQRTALDREGRRIRFEVDYRTGGRKHSGRWTAIIERWMRPSLWSKPLYVTMVMTQESSRNPSPAALGY